MRGAKTIKNVQLSEDEIRNLCLESREIFLSQPMLLELKVPLKICGKSIISGYLSFVNKFTDTKHLSNIDNFCFNYIYDLVPNFSALYSKTNAYISIFVYRYFSFEFIVNIYLI